MLGALFAGRVTTQLLPKLDITSGSLSLVSEGHKEWSVFWL